MVGEIYVQLQQWPLAEHSLVSALAAAPHHAGTHVTLAQILARNVSILIHYKIISGDLINYTDILFTCGTYF